MHLHDYKLICPNYQLFTGGKTCIACKPHKYFNCYTKQCFKNSKSKSALATLEMYIHHRLLKIYEKNINTFIAPSDFMKQKLVEFGWDINKIKLVINPFDAEMSIAKGEEVKQEEEYLLYFGRLGEEKGLEILIEAAALTNSHLKFVGVGPMENKLKKLAEKLKVKAEFLGFKNGPELKYIILRSRAIVIPSIWFENMSLSLLEALNLNKIVIASNIGGIPEIIKHGQNGLLFEPGNVNDLTNKIKSLARLDINSIKQNAKESVKDLSADNNLKQVEAIYQKILNK
jgi:glycosyltransferase involved in cell wall biosynthesis